MSGSVSLTELQSSIDELAKLVCQLAVDLTTYRTVYSNQENVDVVNNNFAIKDYFAQEQGRLADYVKLQFARLFDPPTTGKNRSNTNLTFPALVVMLNGHATSSFVQSIQVRINTLKTKLDPVIKERHKRIAHLDRQIALNITLLTSIGSMSLDDLSTALRELEAVLNDVNMEINQKTMDFSDCGISGAAAVKRIIYHFQAPAEEPSA